MKTYPTGTHPARCVSGGTEPDGFILLAARGDPKARNLSFSLDLSAVPVIIHWYKLRKMSLSEDSVPVSWFTGWHLKIQKIVERSNEDELKCGWVNVLLKPPDWKKEHWSGRSTQSYLILSSQCPRPKTDMLWFCNGFGQCLTFCGHGYPLSIDVPTIFFPLLVDGIGPAFLPPMVKQSTHHFP